MEKYEFIKLMLQSRNLSVNDKKRLVLLATSELENKKPKDEDDEVKDFIVEQNKLVSDKDEKVSDRKDIASNENHKSTEDHRKSVHRKDIDARYVNPSVLKGFLLNYNQDKILKYTCHEIDDDDDIDVINKECGTENYDLEKHATLINKRFADLLEDYQKTNQLILQSKMVSLMRVYVSGKDYNGTPSKWSSLNIKTNWQDEELLAWGKENPQKIPCPGKNIAQKQQNEGFFLTTKQISNLSGKPIRDLKSLVIYFKSLFHIRRDNSLKAILEYCNNGLFDKGKVIINFSDSNFDDNIELFTDVDKLIQAYKKIVNICCDKQMKKLGDVSEIELSFYEENKNEENHIYFCIHHKNSIYGKTAHNATERIGKDQCSLIKNQINGLCDLFIEADFGKKSYRINLWDSNAKMEALEIGQMKGVKYILRF